MVRRELITIGLSFILVAALAGVIAISAYAITSVIDAPQDKVEQNIIVDSSPVITA